MKTRFSLLFYLKKPKHYESGPIPIYLRITVEGKRSETSCGRECLSEKWNTASGRANGTKEEIKALNSYLDTIQAQAYEANRLLMEANVMITAESLKNKLTGKDEKPHSLVDIFKDHNKQIEVLVGEEYAAGTLERYTTCLSHTVDFLKWKFHISDIDIRNVNHEFVTSYEFYLRSVRKCNNNTAVKYIKNFKKIIKICLANSWITKDPFINYKSKVKDVDRVFLDEVEVETLVSKIFRTERLNQVKDIFVFCCFTGLAYVDVKKLNRNHIVRGIDGEKWIHTNRTKTDTRSNIPLLPTSLFLLNKYKDHPQCLNEGLLLPVLSNQKMNEYLKEIATLCEINKDFTFHTARHTFATTITLNNGVPIESVSKMLGHKNLRTTQHYAKILDSKVGMDMKLLREKMSLQASNPIANIG